MYLDTHSKEGMTNSVCKILGVSYNQIKELFNYSAFLSQTKSYFDKGIFNDELNKFILKHQIKENVDYILFFHLTRRLNNSSMDFSGKNLKELLLTDNEISSFLKNHNVEFKFNGEYIDIYYNKKLIQLKEGLESNIPYLKSRLGHFKYRKDYCFNGFAFKDLLYRNDYAKNLFYGPEFITVIWDFLNCPTIKIDYFKNSKYFCYEYLVPIKNVYFDEVDSLNTSKKAQYLINKILNRLFDYEDLYIDNISDYQNPGLRLNDDVSMNEKYFVSKEEISREMLKY